jgi:putative transcriptional regulator
MMAKKAFDKIISGLVEAEAFLAGKKSGAEVTTIPAVNVRAIRTKVGGSREAFSNRFGLDSRAVQDWEQGRRTPDRSTRILMLMIENEPKVVERTVAKAMGSTRMPVTRKTNIRTSPKVVAKKSIPLRRKSTA